ncbi:MAG: FAD:protein FMN transferase, partial [Phycisphaerae bacterium]|nr:FAD:protein FMN transferase [Phycisphaerae bacterium]
KLMNIHSWKIKISHLLGSVFAAVFVSVLFYSSFGTNWQGIADSVMTYAAWGKRAGGQSVHVHPWYFYLNLLTWNEFTEPMTWNEDGIVVLAVFGVIFAFTRRTLLINRPALIRFWAIYTVILAVIYCSISYKTPWCVLGFLYGMAILAGFVIDWLVRISETCWEKICLGLLIVIFVILSPVVQSWMLNFHYASEPTNPYVYAHTSTDIYPMVEAVNKAANASGTGKQMPIQVIAAGDDYWPLSWYLRTYTKVGYWSDVNHSAYKAPVILTNAEHEQKLLDVLYSVPEPGQRYLYVPLFEKNMQLRPGVEWRGYIRKNLWDRMNTAQEPVPVSPEQKGSGWVNKPDKKQIENLLKFSHEAMNTSFEVYIQDPRGTYAGRAARAAFNEVDCLEKLLSRFIQNSDVSRINHSTPGETVIVDEDTMTCLLIAKKAYEITKGAFDVTIGNMIETEKNGGLKQARQQLTEQSSMDMLELDKDAFAVKRLNETVNIDLGGIGKGYAVDTIARVLTEWGIQTALIHGGSSSVCAMAPPQGRQGWPITITNPVGEEIVCRLELTNEVLSCSGLEKGGHIIDPSTGKPVTDRIACWVRLSESAALADALSTAGMIVPLDKIQDLTHEFPDIFLMLIMDSADTGSGELLKFGRWPDN